MVGVITIAVAVLIALLGALTVIKNFLHVAQPNEILVFSGRKQVLPDGSVIGYRIITGSRAMSIPLLEVVDRMDGSAMHVELDVQAYVKGGISAKVAAVAAVRVATRPPLVYNAVERFLGRTQDEMVLVARETLEGIMRGVLATLSFEEIQGDRLQAALVVMEEANNEFGKLGFVLDTFKLQEVVCESGSGMPSRERSGSKPATGAADTVKRISALVETYEARLAERATHLDQAHIELREILSISPLSISSVREAFERKLLDAEPAVDQEQRLLEEKRSGLDAISDEEERALADQEVESIARRVDHLQGELERWGKLVEELKNRFI